MTSLTRTPRVWLAGLETSPAPVDRPSVRDAMFLRQWEPGDDGDYHTPDGLHHATWMELHARFDLVEVIS